MMANLFGQKINRQNLPPNLLAFLVGVVLAMIVGMAFRKVIDKLEPNRRQTAMYAQAAVTPLSSGTAQEASLPKDDANKTESAGEAKKSAETSAVKVPPEASAAKSSC